VRALLDFYKEPDPRVLAARQKSLDQLKLEEVRLLLLLPLLPECAAAGFFSLLRSGWL
jgi:hypothetical protein